MENVSPILAPDRDLMQDHLHFLFGRATEGRVEITAIHAGGGDVRPQTRFFGVDELEEAVAFAAQVNVAHLWNLYVGVALRRGDVPLTHAADDSAFLRTYVVWADADSEAEIASAQAAYRQANLPPALVVVTGRTPERRVQFWWPLETPISDIGELRATVRGMADALGTDHKVLTGKQLMRLAGSLAWPKAGKEGRVLERTEAVFPDGAPREVSLDQVHRAFPPAERGTLAVSDVVDFTVKAFGGALGLAETITDGREAYAFKLVRANLRQWMGEQGTVPTVEELYRETAPVYLAKADQSRPGRGPAFLLMKCREAVEAFRHGLIPGMRTLDEAVETWTGKHEPPDAPPEVRRVSRPFAASDLIGEPPARRWVVKDWIAEGAINSLYGDGGLGKTLLAQQLACAVAQGAPWLGLPTARGRVLAVLCEDERDELWRRHIDIKAAMGHAVGNPFQDVWLWPRVGDDNVIVRWNRDSAVNLGPFYAELTLALDELQPDLLILDTLADVYGGNEIDRPQVNYFVKTVLGGLVAARKAQGRPLTVLLLGHPSINGKATGHGYSGSTAWNNAVRSRMYLTRPEEGPSDERTLTRGKANYASSGDETALRLFFADGVLRASDDAEEGDSLLWAACRDVVQLVNRAWDGGEPYAAKKGHRRFIHQALAADLARAGFDVNLTRQAIRECIEDARIAVAKSNGKSGYRGGGHAG